MSENNRLECLRALTEAGINYDDAAALRRISMTLHRWHELECGDSNEYQSICLVRGHLSHGVFTHDDNGAPFLETHNHIGSPKPHHYPYADKEKGALNRLKAIMDRYPDFLPYVQTDPRGCALYIVPKAALRDGDDLSAVYTRGIAVYK